MAPHSSILAGKIPWTEEPGRLESMGGSQKSRTGLDAQRTILIPELTEKYYNFTDMIPSLQILDFNSKGILQLSPLWNPIIIIGGKEKIKLPKLT